MSSWIKNVLNFLNGFRKLTICLLVIIIAVSLVLSGYIDGKMFTDLVKGVVTAYFAGNVGEHLTNTVKDFVKERFKK